MPLDAETREILELIFGKAGGVTKDEYNAYRDRKFRQAAVAASGTTEPTSAMYQAAYRAAQEAFAKVEAVYDFESLGYMVIGIKRYIG